MSSYAGKKLISGKDRLYVWVRVDVACVTADGVAVGLGFWPTTRAVRSTQTRTLADRITAACKAWLQEHKADLSNPGSVYVHPSEALIPEATHVKLLQRYSEFPTDSPHQIYPTARSLPLPEEVCHG